MNRGNRHGSAPHARARSARAFTLVEVIVTVSVIAILIGITLPALHSAQSSARQVACTNNLRHLISAAFSYSASNAEAMPPAVIMWHNGGNVRTVCWDFQPGPEGTVLPGPLWQYTDTPLEVQQCPDFLGNSTAPNDPFTGYNYNTTFIGHEGNYPSVEADGTVTDGWRATRMGRPVSAFARPESVAVFGDGGWRNGANKFMRAPMNSVEGNLPLVCAGTQAFRHVGGCTCCAYLDGHVGVVQQSRKGALTTPALATLVTDFPNNGFLSEDDSAYAPR
jgi:prepilin-type N-terminal cleavage/methylation domain-containing protein